MTERTYRIGEAARLLDLEGYVLRFWETEFPQLQPARTPKGQRVYSEANLLVLRRIRELLHEQGMTIEGARRVLAGEATAPLDGLPLAQMAASPLAVLPLPGMSGMPGPEAAQAPIKDAKAVAVLSATPGVRQKSGAPLAHGAPVQAFLPLFPVRPARDQGCLDLLSQVEHELLSLQRLLRQSG